MQSAHSLVGTFPEDLDGIIGSMEMFVLGRRGNRSLVNPLAPIPSEGEEPEPYADVSSLSYRCWR